MNVVEIADITDLSIEEVKKILQQAKTAVIQ
jgi:DNA-directed RNA polymerase specialized sigma24 family protein